MSARGRIGAALGLIVLGLAPRPSTAQDFGGPAPAGPPPGPAGFIERGLPPVTRALTLEVAHVSLSGVPDLTTRAASLGGAFRGVAAGVGLSQTGDAAFGWSAGALVVGAAGPSAAAAFRALIRRDRSAAARLESPDRGLGGEVGAGAWLLAARMARVWASAPQLWLHGAAPPLPRGLEIGVRIEGSAAAAWLARESPPPGWRTAGDHVGGVGLEVGPARIWLEARDRPLRGTLGASAAVAILRVAAAIESHPVLGETARLSLAIGAQGSGPVAGASPDGSTP